MRKPTKTGWQQDGSFIPRIPNAKACFTATEQSGEWLLLRGKSGWGDRYQSLEDIKNYLRKFKKENSPVYWSKEYQSHTSPRDHLFETVNSPGSDWVKVDLEVYLNKEYIY